MNRKEIPVSLDDIKPCHAQTVVVLLDGIRTNGTYISQSDKFVAQNKEIKSREWFYIEKYR